MPSSLKRQLAAAVVVLFGLVRICPAGTITIYDGASHVAYDAAVKTTASTDFHGITCITSYYCGAAGTSFTGYLNEGQHADMLVANFGGITGSGSALKGPAYNSGRSFIQVLLPGDGTNALSLDLYGVDDTLGSAIAMPVIVKLYRGTTLLESLSLNTAAGGSLFLGLTSADGITEVRLYADQPNSYLLLDGFSYGALGAGMLEENALSDVPEVASLLACGSGLLLLMGCRWLRRGRMAG